MWPDPDDWLRWLMDRVWSWLCLVLLGALAIAVVLTVLAAVFDVGPFVVVPAAAPTVTAPDPCCECEADLAECEADPAAWREQAVRCVDDVLEVKAR